MAIGLMQHKSATLPLRFAQCLGNPDNYRERRYCRIANRNLNGASQQKLNHGTNVRLIKNSPEYLLIHFHICNFSLPCTPFENLS
jgi:hypothetical protein